MRKARDLSKWKFQQAGFSGWNLFSTDCAGIRRLRTAGMCRAPRRGKRVDTKVSTLLTPTSFYFVVRRRPENGDRFEKGNGSRVTAACLSPPFRSSQTAYCYTCRLRRLNRMCSSTVTELRIGKRKGQTRSRSVLMRGKILCRIPFSKRSPVSGLRQTKKQRKRDSQGWKPWCPSLCPPPWVRR